MLFERSLGTPVQAGELVEFLRSRGWMTAQQISAVTRWSARLARDMIAKAIRTARIFYRRPTIEP